MEFEKEFNNQAIVNENGIGSIDNIYKIGKATIKIFTKNSIAWGFFIKLERNKKPFYCLMTNQHVIKSEMMHKKEKFTILYDNENKLAEIELNPKERIIICFLEKLKIDVTLIEIIPKDNIIDPSYFLSPYINNENVFNTYRFIKRNIEIIQYPNGKELCLSKGVILGIHPENDNMFMHNSNTKDGSSGSPIFLPGDERIFAIHKGQYKITKENSGIFIEPIIKYLKNYKRNGEGIEYYEDGSIKYEGEFLDDEYNGKGKLYYSNGDYYEGQFKHGEKFGNGYEYYKNGKIKNEKILENDALPDKEYNFNVIQNEFGQNITLNINRILKMLKGSVKIQTKSGIASGFFIKLERNKKPFYCLMTNQYVITSEMINGKETINILYENESKILELKLNQKERIILCFMKINKLDTTLIEIVQKDEIDESYFLKPYIEPVAQAIGQKITLIHFPNGKENSMSNGKILKIDDKNKNLFFHDAYTVNGSGGCPIFLEREAVVIGIHKGYNPMKGIKCGIFIKDIIDFMKDYKKLGE